MILLSTTNEDGTANLAPVSSSFALGWRMMLGVATSGKTAENLRRTGELVLNLPTSGQVSAVDRLALTTGAHTSKLASIDEEHYRSRDTARGREAPARRCRPAPEMPGRPAPPDRRATALSA